MKKYFDELLNMFKNSFDSIDEKKFNELLNDCTDTLKAGKKIILSGLPSLISEVSAGIVVIVFNYLILTIFSL